MEIEMGGSGVTAKITLDVTQDIPANKSTLTVTQVLIRANSTTAIGSCRVVGSIRIDGSAAAELVYTGNAVCGVSLAGGNYSGGGTNWSGFTNHAVAVTHGADGTKKISVGISLSVTMTTGAYIGAVSGTAQANLPTIPRVSGVSAQGVTLGNEMTVTLTRASASFRDTVSWSCGSQSGTIASKTALTSMKWTPPVSLAAQNTAGTSVPVTLTVTTYSGDTAIGSKSISVSCPIPAGVVPTLTVTVSDKMGHTASHGGYIQNQSQARVQTAAAGAQGSTIRSIAVKCGSLTGSGADVAFSLPASGSVSITVTVTDSRGRTASATKTITVLAYSKPSITITDLYRSDSAGNRQPDGSYAVITFHASVTNVTGQTAKYTGIRKEHNGSAVSAADWTDLDNQLTLTGKKKVYYAAVGTAYDFTVQVRDAFQTVTSNVMLLAVAFALLDFDKANKAAGIGMRATAANTLGIGLAVNMTEHRITNLAAPSAGTDAANKTYVDGRFATGSTSGTFSATYKWSNYSTLTLHKCGNIVTATLRAYKCSAGIAQGTSFATVPEGFRPGSNAQSLFDSTLYGNTEASASSFAGVGNITIRTDGTVAHTVGSGRIFTCYASFVYFI